MSSSGLMSLKFPNTSNPFSKVDDASKNKPMKPMMLKLENDDDGPPKMSQQSDVDADGDAADATTVTPTPSTTGEKKPRKWRCDVCKNKHFDDFEAACAHEKECEKQMKKRKQQKKLLMQKQQQQKQAQEKAERKKQQQQQVAQQEKQKEVTVESEMEQRQPNKAPIRDPSDQEEQQAAPTKKRRQKRKDEEKVMNKQKKPQLVSKPTRQTVPKAKKSEPKREEKKKETKSKPTTSAAPASSTTHSFFAPRKPGAANSKKRPSPDKKASATVTAFFQPRTAKKQKGSSSTSSTPSMSQQSTIALSQSSSVIEIPDDAPSSTNSAAEVQFVGSKQPKKTRKRGTTTKQEEVTVDNAHHVANALAAMITRQTSVPSSSQSSLSSLSSSKNNANLPIAGIFTMLPSKELLAEQRQAEFQAKRRLERQKELERQQKRQARVLSEPIVRKPSSSCSTAKTVVPKLPLAPRFPVPSHVMNTTLDAAWDPAVNIRVPEIWKQSMDTDDTSSTTTNGSHNQKLVSSPCALDCVPEMDHHSIQTALHQVLVPKKSFVGNHHYQNNENNISNLLLVDQYSNHLVGESIQNIERDLVQWVREWCKVRQDAYQRMMERQRKLAKRPKARVQKKKKKPSSKNYYDDDLWDDDDDDDNFEGELGNLVLLTGDSGSGKTALVHQVAHQCQCPVLEINTTQARGGAALKHAIQEATQSCSSLDMIKRQSRKLMQSPFAEDSDDEQAGEEASKKTSALTVILIDEVDFLFEEDGDAGFWSALASVTKTAKCPIFVTANTMPPPMQQLPRFHHWNLPMPSPDECMTKLLQVCRQEGIPMRPELNRDEIKSRLCKVAETCRSDIRRMLNELQSFLYPVPADRFLTSNDKVLPAENGSSLTNASNLDWSASIELPRMDSLNPKRVSRRKHSIVTIRGKNFSSLPRFKGEWNVMLGNKQCKSHVVDDENLLILCPPQSQEEEQDFEPISIQLSNGGRIGCTSVETLDLPGGSKITGRRCVWLHYEDSELLSQEDENDDDDEEIEFEGSEEQKPKEDLKISIVPKDVVEEGNSVLDSWKSISKGQSVDKRAPVEQNSKSQDIRLGALELLAENACDLSDAALLEDFQHGVPSLSGACLGYGFDLTDGAECEKGKMKMSEQLRPPREERLYELGWKDSCYFFGNAETYMVHPTTALERLMIRSEMKHSRCLGYHVAPPTSCESKEEGEDEIDIEELAADNTHSTSEDKYLPLNTSALVLSLPSIIRQEVGRKSSYYHSFDESVFDMSRKQQLASAQELSSKMRGLQRQPQTHVISPFVVEDKKSATYVLELLPMLRRVSMLERDSEQINSVAAEDRNVRSTRTRSRRGRRHYFEKLGFVEDHGQETTASKAGQTFAESFLVYDKTEKKME